METQKSQLHRVNPWCCCHDWMLGAVDLWLNLTFLATWNWDTETSQRLVSTKTTTCRPGRERWGRCTPPRGQRGELSPAGHSGGQDYFPATGFQAVPPSQCFTPNGLLYSQLNSPIVPSIPGKMQKNRHFSPWSTEPGNVHMRHQECNERVKQKVHSKCERYTCCFPSMCPLPKTASKVHKPSPTSSTPLNKDPGDKTLPCPTTLLRRFRSFCFRSLKFFKFNTLSHCHRLSLKCILRLRF